MTRYYLMALHLAARHQAALICLSTSFGEGFEDGATEQAPLAAGLE